MSSQRRLLSICCTGFLLAVACDREPIEAEAQCSQRYPIDVLRDWKDNKLAGVWTVNGVTATGIDDLKQCLFVGVENARFIPQVEARLQEIEIPRAAVYIVIRPHAPAVFMFPKEHRRMA